ncbi:hypothetical protein WCN79_21405 [Xanthomonas axonopodis pv. vasculorum]|uniref:hypothetical protein n=1 Tax=Xanthomonas axonopodis TaxID=53413 RepID=UPI001070CFDF|nr:hypothetical protein [Xanthomonas axonopodis]QKD85438.1 hypothetical protein XAV_01925 [Xanthomonas axonopodis pv. vasculorum]
MPTLRKVLIIASVLFLSAWTAIENKSEEYVKKSFLLADFSPYVYNDLQITRRYGMGEVSELKYDFLRSFYDKPAQLWVTFIGDKEVSSEFRLVQEVLISKYGPLKKREGRLESISKISLFGVKIGDSRRSAETVAKGKRNFSSSKTLLFGNEVDQVVFFPEKVDSNMFYKFYLRSGKVVGIAVCISG